MKIFVNYPICKTNVAAHWESKELDLTIDNLYDVIENIDYELILHPDALYVKVQSQRIANELISKHVVKPRNKRNEIIKFVQDYLKEYSFYDPINLDEESASHVFAGAICYAATVFVNRLVLGGAYKNTKNYESINECLKQLKDLLK